MGQKECCNHFDVTGNRIYNKRVFYRNGVKSRETLMLTEQI